MMSWIAIVLGLVAAYFLGSLPTGYLAGRALKGIDIREQGSKSTGATNVLRTIGPWPAALVFLVDMLKGSAAVFFARWLMLALGTTGWEPWAVSIAGIAAIVGHGRSVWLNFSGGKSVATGLGVLVALSWQVALGALAVFAIALAISRIVSLSSILAALTATVLVFVLPQPLPNLLMVVAGGLYVIIRHRANIARILAGTEPRLGRATPER
ncbi:MAG TPA: glycerol-3-phosphate 1-O-acyltransferase PlsY [Devosia sp.]